LPAEGRQAGNNCHGTGKDDIVERLPAAPSFGILH
jgi:hypothetical protein